MRETCARVLAAALMTGAIATALGLPAAFDGAEDPIHGLTAPPSSLQRTVRVPAVTARERPARAERLVTVHSSRPTAVRPRIVRHLTYRTVAPHARPAPHPAAKPSTPTAPQPETRELSATTPEVARPAPTSSDEGKGKKGKGHGKGKGKEKADEPAAPQGAAPSTGEGAPPPAESQGEADGQKEHGNGNGHGNEKGKDHGHGKED